MKHILIFCLLLSLFSLSAFSELTDADYEKLRSMLREQTDELKQELKQELKASEKRLKAHISQTFAKTHTSLDALDRNHRCIGQKVLSVSLACLLLI